MAVDTQSCDCQFLTSDLLQVSLVALDQRDGIHEKLLYHLHCGRVDILDLLQAPGHLPNFLYKDLLNMSSIKLMALKHSMRLDYKMVKSKILALNLGKTLRKKFRFLSGVVRIRGEGVDDAEIFRPFLANKRSVLDVELSQGCISCLTCSFPEQTKDHVLTSAYVNIFRTVTRNAVNKSV